MALLSLIDSNRNSLILFIVKEIDIMVKRKLKKLAVIAMAAVIAVTGAVVPAPASAAENSEIMPLDGPVSFYTTLPNTTDPVAIGSFIYRGTTAGIQIHLTSTSLGGYPIKFMVKDKNGNVYDTVSLSSGGVGLLSFPPGVSSGTIYAYNPVGVHSTCTIGGTYSY